MDGRATPKRTPPRVDIRWKRLGVHRRARRWGNASTLGGERPSNENLDRQSRFWLPKGTDLGRYDQNALDRITNVLNNQPGKMFDWQIPAQHYAGLAMR